MRQPHEMASEESDEVANSKKQDWPVVGREGGSTSSWNGELFDYGISSHIMGLSAQAAKNLLISGMHCSCRLILNSSLMTAGGVLPLYCQAQSLGVTWGAASGPLMPLGRSSGSLPRTGVHVVRWHRSQPWDSTGALFAHWKYFKMCPCVPLSGKETLVTWVWPGQQKAGTFRH